jgi:putative spermidine/putrescine transport system substrate-binding protein
MTRAGFAVGRLLLAGLALLAVSATAEDPKSAGEGLVDIVAWPGYIERGASDPRFDWVTGFEVETGCQVRLKVAGTSDEMVALMNEGGFDLATVSGDATLRLISGSRVQPIETARIPQWESIDERLKNAPWHTVDGVHYGVPYQWGSNVLMYNTDVFEKPPSSWKIVFEPSVLPDGKSNQGARPGLRRTDLHRRCGSLSHDRAPRARHRRSLRAESAAVRSGPGAIARPAKNRQSLLA